MELTEERVREIAREEYSNLKTERGTVAVR